MSSERSSHRQLLKGPYEGNAYFQSLFSNASIGAALLDQDNCVLEANQACCNILGYSREELVGQCLSQLTHPQDREANSQLHASLLAGQCSSYTVDERFIREDGLVVWGRLNVSLIQNSVGQPSRTLVLCEDITQRRQAEDSLLESEQRLKDVLYSMADWLFEVDNDFIITYCSPRVYDALGYTATEMVGKTPFDYITPEERPRMVGFIRDIFKEVKPFKDIESWNIRKDGQRVCFLTSGVPIFNRHGKFCGFRGINTDITQRKHAEQALRESEENYRMLIQNQGEGLGIVDEHECFSFANPAAESIFGVSPGGLIGRSLQEFTSPEQYALILQQTERRRGGEKDVYELEIRRLDGKIRILRVTATPQFDNHKRFAGAIAVLVDITERIQAEQALAAHDRQMAALYETSLAINVQPDLPTLLLSIVEHAAGLLGAHMGALYLLEPDQQTLKMVVSYNLSSDYLGVTLRMGEGLSGRVALTGNPLNIADHKHWDGRAEIFKDSPFRRVLGVPVKRREHVIGVINITDDHEIGLFTPSEVRLASLFADQAAIAIENTRLLSETNRRAELLALVNEFSSAINQPLELPAVLQAAVDGLARVLNLAQTGLALFDDTFERLLVAADHPAPGSQPSVGTELPLQDNLAMQRILETKKMVYIQDAQHDPLMANLHSVMAQRQVSSILIVPLIVCDEVIGTIGCDGIGEPRVFNPDEIWLAETVANLTAVRIEQARLFETVQRQAIIDELTGLYNYRGLLELGARDVERAIRFNHPLCALFFDIDHFRDFNNRYSHAVGNQVLQAVARTASATTRTVDLVTRFGGEEFVILLPETRLKEASMVAERLRQAVQAQHLSTRWGELGVTISVGVAGLTPNVTELAALIDRANQAEHLAKERGRNRVEIIQTISSSSIRPTGVPQ